MKTSFLILYVDIYTAWRAISLKQLMNEMQQIKFKL